MKKKIFLFLLITLITIPLFATNNEKYEYMVVSFGKAQFSEIRSKTMAYWEDGISKEALSAISYENNLDILGEHGWEVLSVTGSIGGDQQVILKRNLEIKRSENELKTIDENSNKVIKGMLDILIAEDNKSEKAEKPQLIELDSYEKELAIAKQRSEFEKYLTTSIKSLEKQPIEFIFDWDDSENEVTLIIEYDVTKECLINNDQYRESVVKNQLRLFIEPLKKQYSKSFLIGSISCNGYITYQNFDYYCGHLYTYASSYGKNGWSEL
jgi:hypothetical protein